jgi:hypothetical protein
VEKLDASIRLKHVPPPNEWPKHPPGERMPKVAVAQEHEFELLSPTGQFIESDKVIKVDDMGRSRFRYHNQFVVSGDPTIPTRRGGS